MAELPLAWPGLDIALIRKRADAATHGPWEVMPELCGPGGQGVYCTHAGPVVEVGDPYPRSCNSPQESMEFIAAARSDVPALCDEVVRLRQENAELRRALERARWQIGRLENFAPTASVLAVATEAKDEIDVVLVRIDPARADHA